MTQKFHISTVFTVATEVFMAPLHPDYLGNPNNNGMREVKKLLAYMTGETPATHQLPRFHQECKPYMPKFTRAWDEECNRVIALKLPNDAQVEEFIAIYERARREHGDWIEVSPMPTDDHDTIDPLTELRQMRPDLNIYIIDTGSDQ